MHAQRFSHAAGAFEITSLPGQSQVAICHSFFVRHGQRGRGMAHVIKAKQRQTLKDFHYDYAICTVAASNLAQQAVLTQDGWHKLAEFKNHRSNEVTEIWGTQP